LALQYLSREYRLSYLFSSFWTLLEPIFRTFFFLLLYLQHSERIKQDYLRRNCWREMLQQLKSLLSYRIEKEFQVCSWPHVMRFFAIRGVTYRLWWQNRNKDCRRRTYAI
jgi:NhaP-type Na+/H+ or K+/H+ antiporter